MTLPFITIPRRSAICAKGQEVLEPGAEYYSVLIDNGTALQRQDFCLACWKTVRLEEGIVQAKTHWKSRVVAKKEVVDHAPDRDAKAMVLLIEQLAQQTADEQAEAFILALYLARRRLLYLRQQLIDEKGVMMQLYEVAATEEMLAVPKLILSPKQIAAVQVRLAAKLK